MDIFGDIFDWFSGFLGDVLSWVTALLPDSPFQAISNSAVSEYLPYINWFLPFDFVVTTLGLWLLAVAGYYIYSVVLRWIKAVE